MTPDPAHALPAAGIVVLDSVTKLAPAQQGAGIVAASHGGAYAAYLAAAGGARAVVLNDAGVGRDEAGIASLVHGERFGMAVATLSHLSCRIGLGADMVQNGVVSRVNRIAAAAGCRAGMACGEAAALLAAVPAPTGNPPPYGEARRIVALAGGWRLVLVDSAALVRPEDAGQIVVTGSHGGLVGGRPAMALQVEARAALFNDAGIGRDEAGVARLWPLEQRGIAAAAVSAETARIGEARSTWEDGVLSRVNRIAAMLGARPGMPARELVERIATMQRR